MTEPAAAGITAYWDDFAEAYDREPDHGLGHPATREAWRRLLEPLLPGAPADLADLACGTGSLSLLAAQLGHHVVGVDVSERMLARARAKSTGMSVQLVRANVAAPGLSAGRLDVVLARHILWTLPDPVAVLASWRTLLRRPGRFVLVEGRWSSAGDEQYDVQRQLPWSGGVRADVLAAAVRDVAAAAKVPVEIEVTVLDDEVLWGKTVDDERYVLLASFGE